MSTYQFLYVREQRVLVDIKANDIETATTEAWDRVKTLSLKSADDESDDVGALLLEEILIDT